MYTSLPVSLQFLTLAYTTPCGSSRSPKQNDLRDETVVRDHHRHGPKQGLQVVRKLLLEVGRIRKLFLGGR